MLSIVDNVATSCKGCDTMTQRLLPSYIYKGIWYFTIDPWGGGYPWGDWYVLIGTVVQANALKGLLSPFWKAKVFV